MRGAAAREADLRTTSLLTWPCLNFHYYSLFLFKKFKVHLQPVSKIGVKSLYNLDKILICNFNVNTA